MKIRIYPDHSWEFDDEHVEDCINAESDDHATVNVPDDRLEDIEAFVLEQKV